MDIDDVEYTGTYNSTTSPNRQENTVDLENLISGLRQDNRGTRNDDGNTSTSSKVLDIEHMRRIWISERMSPDLLPFEGDLIDRIMTRVRNQVRTSNSVSSFSTNKNETQYIEETSMNMQLGNDSQLKVLLVETELERVKYLLRGYLRTRLSKVCFSANGTLSNEYRLTNTHHFFLVTKKKFKSFPRKKSDICKRKLAKASSNQD